eukprot:jgi/Pico_ML_1/50761/g1914.t1
MSQPGSAGGAAANKQAVGKATEALDGAVQANRPWWKTFAEDVRSGKASAKFSDGAKKMQEKFKGKGLNMGMKVDVDMFGPTFDSLKKNGVEAWMTLPPEEVEAKILGWHLQKQSQRQSRQRLLLLKRLLLQQRPQAI